MKTIYNRIIVIYIYRIKLTTHNTERQHSAFFILIRLFDIVIKNNGNKLSMCITTILRNKESVQSLTRIQNIPHMYLLMTFHLLVWTVPLVCLFRANLKTLSAFGYQVCIFGYILFYFSNRDRTNKKY